ncbi:MAG: YwbE family protein [Flammeovirgaceae bacterium]
MSDGRNRNNIKIGYYVAVVEKHNQRTNELTHGEVKRILTKSAFHPHGIKVMLDTGEVGRVKEILETE